MAGKKDLNIYQGATFRFDFSLSQVVDGVESPVDITNATAKMQIRPSYSSNTLYLDLGADGYISITDPINGTVTIDVPASVTETLDFSSAVYDIDIVFQDGFVLKLVQGNVILSLGVTR